MLYRVFVSYRSLLPAVRKSQRIKIQEHIKIPPLAV